MGAEHITLGWFVLDQHLATGPDGTVDIEPETARHLERVVDGFASALERSTLAAVH